MRTIIRHLANACHSLLTLPIIALLTKGAALLTQHHTVQGAAWLAAGIASVYLWHFGGRWVLGLLAAKPRVAPAI